MPSQPKQMERQNNLNLLLVVVEQTSAVEAHLSKAKQNKNKYRVFVMDHSERERDWYPYIERSSPPKAKLNSTLSSDPKE